MYMIWLIAWLALVSTASADESIEVPLTIADPFIELHTGPGSGYPIFYVVDRGQQIIVLQRKTNWYQVRARNGKVGWASREQMQQTLLPGGSRLKFAELGKSEFIARRWEIGVTGGEFEGAPITSLYGGYAFTENMSSELTLGHSVGTVSSSLLFKLNLLMQPFPDLRYPPFFTLGLGSINVDPNATLIEPRDKSNQFSQIGIGFRKYLSRRFMFRSY